MGDLPDFVRTREDLIATHLDDNDIVEILTVLKERAKLGSYEHIKIVLEIKYGKNPAPPSSDVTLAELMWGAPTGLKPADDAI